VRHDQKANWGKGLILGAHPSSLTLAKGKTAPARRKRWSRFAFEHTEMMMEARDSAVY
jgi:hypothetical protein